MVRLEIQADSAADLNGQLVALVGAVALGAFPTGDLIAHLRARMSEKGLVVNIDPVKTFVQDEAPVADKPKSNRGRPPKASSEPQQTSTDKVPESVQNCTPEEKKVEVALAQQPEPGTNEYEDKQRAEAARPLEIVKSADAPSPAAPPATVPTRDEVIAALNAYAAPRGGQVAGRTMMQKICNVTRLQDIPADKYGELIAALKAADEKAADEKAAA